jgi:hypothetical protein
MSSGCLTHWVMFQAVLDQLDTNLFYQGAREMLQQQSWQAHGRWRTWLLAQHAKSEPLPLQTIIREICGIFQSSFDRQKIRRDILTHLRKQRLPLIAQNGNSKADKIRQKTGATTCELEPNPTIPGCTIASSTTSNARPAANSNIIACNHIAAAATKACINSTATFTLIVISVITTITTAAIFINITTVPVNLNTIAVISVIFDNMITTTTPTTTISHMSYAIWAASTDSATIRVSQFLIRANPGLSA